MNNFVYDYEKLGNRLVKHGIMLVVVKWQNKMTKGSIRYIAISNFKDGRFGYSVKAFNLTV